MLPSLLTMWGLVTTLQGFSLFLSFRSLNNLNGSRVRSHIFWTSCLPLLSRSFGGLVHSQPCIHLLLTLVQGGVLPGLVLYLSFFYPRQLLHWRYIPMILPHTVTQVCAECLSSSRQPLLLAPSPAFLLLPSCIWMVLVTNEAGRGYLSLRDFSRCVSEYSPS